MCPNLHMAVVLSHPQGGVQNVLQSIFKHASTFEVIVVLVVVAVV